jgi:hypothetical protein
MSYVRFGVELTSLDGVRTWEGMPVADPLFKWVGDHFSCRNLPDALGDYLPCGSYDGHLITPEGKTICEGHCPCAHWPSFRQQQYARAQIARLRRQYPKETTEYLHIFTDRHTPSNSGDAQICESDAQTCTDDMYVPTLRQLAVYAVVEDSKDLNGEATFRNAYAEYAKKQDAASITDLLGGCDTVADALDNMFGMKWPHELRQV